MTKYLPKNMQWIVFLTGVLISIYAYWPAFFDPYIIADDVRITNYWMYQFQDSELFQNDVITDYAKNYTTWGYNFLYYLASFIWDPMFFGHIISVLMLAVTGMYMYKIVEHFSGTFPALLTALMTVPSMMLVSGMAGGTPRTFAYPLISAFLYYLIKKKEGKVSLVLILGCLFYPMVFLVSFMTYAMTFLRNPRKGFFLDTSKQRWMIIVLTALACGGILIGKHILHYNPNIGKTYSKAELKANPENYIQGRIGKLLPYPSVLKMLPTMLRTGSTLMDVGYVYIKPKDFVVWIILSLLMAILIYEYYKGRIKIPKELIYITVASLIMYVIAEMVMLKLYLPRRYLKYTIPLMGIILNALVIHQIILKFKPPLIKKLFQIAVVILMIWFMFPISRRVYFLDVNDKRELLEFVAQFPKDAMVAAHPRLADDIPLFSKRKVFINYEMSHPFYDQFWPMMRNRTLNFFRAYYSNNPALILDFLKHYEIDYFIVEKKYFDPSFLGYRTIYFEPINRIIWSEIKGRQTFALMTFPDKLKLYNKDGIFIIKTDDLINYLQGER